MCGTRLRKLLCGLLVFSVLSLDFSWAEKVLTDEEWSKVKQAYEELKKMEEEQKSLMNEREQELTKREESLNEKEKDLEEREKLQKSLMNEKEGNLARKEHLLNEREKDLVEREKLQKDDSEQQKLLEKSLKQSKNEVRKQKFKTFLYGVGGTALGILCGYVGYKIISK